MFLGSPDYVPKFHAFDEPIIITRVIERLLCTDDSVEVKCTYIETILVKSKIPSSGFGASYPCKLTNLCIADLLPHPRVSLVQALLFKGYTVTIKDLKKATEILSEEHVKVFQLLCEHFITGKQLSQVVTEICYEAISREKFYFVPFFLTMGVKPLPGTILKTQPFHELDTTFAEYVANECDPFLRTDTLKKCLTTGAKQHIVILLKSGKILPGNIDLSEFVLSPAVLKKPELVEDLIKVGISPLGFGSNHSPITVLFSSKSATPSQLARIGEVLISHGASMEEMKRAYDEKMTPVHVATKIALETGLMYTHIQ